MPLGEIYNPGKFFLFCRNVILMKTLPRFSPCSLVKHIELTKKAPKDVKL